MTTQPPAQAPALPIPATRYTEETTARTGLMPRYAVILHNDDTSAMDFVVQVLLKSVPSLTSEDAASIMLQAHNDGKAVVIVCPLEHAELYRDRIRGFGLACTIEKA